MAHMIPTTPPRYGPGRGPAPPPGKPHRYQFTLYALKESLGLQGGASKEQVTAALEGKVLAQTMLEGLYAR